MIESNKFPNVFFLNDWAQSWAENTVDEDDDNKSAVEAAFDISEDSGQSILILHPDDQAGEERIPDTYTGLVVRFPPNTGRCMLH